MPPCPSSPPSPPTRLTGEQPRQQQVGGRRLRVRPTRRQAKDRRPADPRQPQHRTRVRRHAPPDDAAAERGDRHEERVVRVGAGRARGKHQVGRVPATREAATARLDRVGIVLDVDDVEISEPRPSTFARTDASNRSLAVARTDSLTTTPTRRATNGATHTIGWLPKPAMRAPASTTRRFDQVRRDLHARYEIATLDDLAVEDGEDLERIEPLIRSSSAIRTVTTPSAAATKSRRLWFGPRTSSPPPAMAFASRRAASSSCNSAPDGTSTVTAGPDSAAARASRSSSVSRRPFDQRSPPTVRSRVRTAPVRCPAARRPGTTRSTRKSGRGRVRRYRPSAASIARRV